jgi:putative transposase
MAWNPGTQEQYVRRTHRYPSDLTDAESDLIKGFFEGYVPDLHDIREIVNGCLYFVAEGCQWRAIPRDIAPPGTVRWWWDRFRRDGVWDKVNAVLNRQAWAAAGRNAEPATALIDTQSVKCAPQKDARHRRRQ